MENYKDLPEQESPKFETFRRCVLRQNETPEERTARLQRQR